MPDKFLQKIIVVSLLCLFAVFNNATAQKKDSTKPAKPKDTLTFRQKYAYPNAKIAMLCSVVIPGLGQAYNHKYWKIPIVYAGLGTAAYFIITNQQEYVSFNTALKQRTSNPVIKDQYFGVYTIDDLVNNENTCSRYRNISIMAAAFVYLLNIIDANVDGQLRKFDVSDDISLHFSPQLGPDPFGKFTIQPGFSLVKRF